MTDSPDRLIRLKAYLKRLWCAWVVFRLFAMSVVANFVVADGQMVGAMAWQVVILLPALLFTPFVVRANNAYALILGSFLVMVYWAVSASFLLINIYQKAPIVVSVAYGVEVVLLMAVFFVLFLTTKKMPAMHKQKQATTSK